MEQNSLFVHAVVSDFQHSDLVLVDVEQQYRPWLWPFFLPPIYLWVHVVLTLEDSPQPGAGTVPSSNVY